MEYTRYYGKHKRENKVCPQSSVSTKDDFLKIRLPSSLKKDIQNLAAEKGKSASELTRLLWRDYFKKARDIAWQKEVSEW